MAVHQFNPFYLMTGNAFKFLGNSLCPKARVGDGIKVRQHQCVVQKFLWQRENCLQVPNAKTVADFQDAIILFLL